jgi:hypothetical protein
MLSPFFDNPLLVRTVTSFGDEDLQNWRSFEAVQKDFQNVQLVFRLRKVRP